MTKMIKNLTPVGFQCEGCCRAAGLVIMLFVIFQLVV